MSVCTFILIVVQLTMTRLKIIQDSYQSTNGIQNLIYVPNGIILFSHKEVINTAFSNRIRTSDIIMLRKISHSPQNKFYLFSELWELICRINTHTQEITCYDLIIVSVIHIAAIFVFTPVEQ